MPEITCDDFDHVDQVCRITGERCPVVVDPNDYCNVTTREDAEDHKFHSHAEG